MGLAPRFLVCFSWFAQSVQFGVQLAVTDRKQNIMTIVDKEEKFLLYLLEFRVIASKFHALLRNDGRCCGLMVVLGFGCKERGSRSG